MKNPPRSMPVIQQRPWKMPEGAFAVALVEGHVVRGSDVPLTDSMHVVAFRDGQFIGMKAVNWPESFAMQLPAGRYRLVAFEGGREIASAELKGSLGVHRVALTPEGHRGDASMELEIEADDGGYKN